MDKAYSDTILRIGTAIQDLLKELQVKPDNRIEGWLSVALNASAKAFFNTHASDETKQSFKDICRMISELPDEYKTLIGDSVYNAGASPHHLEKWVTRGRPHPLALPHILKALNQSITIILNENESDAEFRRFYALMRVFNPSVTKAEAGTHWFNADIAHEQVPEYDAEAFELRDKVQAQFLKLDDRFITLMNEKLREYKPVKFAEDLAPPEYHDDPEAMARIRARNIEANRQEAEAALLYQTGQVTIKDLIERLDTGNFKQMSKMASMIGYATHLYYDENSTLIIFKSVNKSGDFINARLPEAPSPTNH